MSAGPVLYLYILVAVLVRVLPHPWNMTPIAAMALFKSLAALVSQERTNSPWSHPYNLRPFRSTSAVRVPAMFRTRSTSRRVRTSTSADRASRPKHFWAR